MDRLHEIIRRCDEAPKPADATLGNVENVLRVLDMALGGIRAEAEAERTDRDALIAAVHCLLAERDDERGTIDCKPDGWCDDCTMGLTQLALSRDENMAKLASRAADAVWHRTENVA